MNNSVSSATIALVTVLAAAVVLLTVGVVVWRKREAQAAPSRGGGVPLLGQLDHRVDAAHGSGIMGGGVVRQTSYDAWGQPGVLVMTPPVGQPAIPDPAKSVQPVVGKEFGAPTTSMRTVAGMPEEWHDLRFQVPEGDAIPFLPGTLEIAAGPDQGRRIRFPHVAGPNGVEITFGRSEGERFRHIELRDQTMSRLHAGLRFADGHWSLRNYSGTTPVVYNHTVVDGDDEPLLEDGDRIEMGAVIFTFHSR